ncbi:glycosyltransferase [Terasakiella pusilla]|uniref:glycosyltransferase n=1 Tax=Terasakiella pusilla TaxID=64973 RepID=UPI003AA82275
MSLKKTSDIVVAGTCKQSIYLWDRLKDTGLSTTYLKTNTTPALTCSVLWVFLDRDIPDLAQFSHISAENILIYLCDTFHEAHTSAQLINELDVFFATHAKARHHWFAQNQQTFTLLKENLPTDRFSPTPLTLPVYPSAPTRIPAKKCQIGIYLEQDINAPLRTILERNKNNPDMLFRFWEEAPLPDESFTGMADSWSFYTSDAFSFQRYCNLVDVLIFPDLPQNKNHLIEAASAGAIPLILNQAESQSPVLAELFAAADALSGNIQTVLQKLATHTALLTQTQKDLQQAAQKLFGMSAFFKAAQIPLALPAPKLTQEDPAPVLFVSTNGIGLGHVTRLLAIAKRCPKTIAPVFAVFSAGVSLVQQAGYPCEHMVSNEYAEVDPMGWHDHTYAELMAIIRFVKPRCVLYDGNVLYPGARRAFGEANLPLLWVRRGLFKEDAPYGPLASQIYADLLIEPGELAHAYDKGPTADHAIQSKWPRRYLKTAPITWVTPQEVLDQKQARISLKMQEQGTHILIQVGAGNIKDTDRLIERILQAFETWPHAHLYIAQWPISDRPSFVADRLTPIQRYPLSPCLKAFDFVISATGYNSFQELMHLNIPSLLIPNAFTRLDDQCARARFASDFGGALMAEAEDFLSIQQGIDALMDSEKRQHLSNKAQELPWHDGAQTVANWLNACVKNGDWPNE